MNDPKNPAQDETTLLHLNKFAPAKDLSPAPAPQEEDPGMTVFIKKAAAETAQASTEPIVVPKAAAAMPPKEMLGAVSYCYAKGVYESDAIEQKMLKDPELRATMGDNIPDAQAIRKFRRLNLSAIKQTIEKAFRLKRRKDKEEMAKPLPGQPEPAVKPPIVEGDSTIFFAKKQAEQKVENAILLDQPTNT